MQKHIQQEVEAAAEERTCKTKKAKAGSCKKGVHEGSQQSQNNCLGAHS
jgi:hypothetical protein